MAALSWCRSLVMILMTLWYAQQPRSARNYANGLQNWPAWRKELNFWSLLMMVAMTGVTKTIFMTVNAQLAESYNVSYTAVAALSGVPLIISAFAGLVCLVGSRICGKRPFYLGSLLLVFIGTVWNTNVTRSYSQCMAARVFQGLGWGAFDTLVLGSIQDTYFVGSIISSTGLPAADMLRNMNGAVARRFTPSSP